MVICLRVDMTRINRGGEFLNVLEAVVQRRGSNAYHVGLAEVTDDIRLPKRLKPIARVPLKEQ